jgi:hypothetical protein
LRTLRILDVAWGIRLRGLRTLRILDVAWGRTLGALRDCVKGERRKHHHCECQQGLSHSDHLLHNVNKRWDKVAGKKLIAHGNHVRLPVHGDFKRERRLIGRR